MLSIQNIVQLIASPRKLNREETDQLRQLIDRFPYSQVFPILYLKSLALSQDILLDNEIQRLAIRIQDRQVLYTLLHSQGEQNNEVVNLTSSESLAEPSEGIQDEIVVGIESNTHNVDTLTELAIEKTIEKIESSESDELKPESLPNTTKDSEIKENQTPDLQKNDIINIEDEAQSNIEREALHQAIQLEKAIELQKQQDIERQKLIDKLTTKPKPIVEASLIPTEVLEETSEEEEKKNDLTNTEARSFTSWLNIAATQKSEVVQKQADLTPPKQEDKDPFVINSAVYSLEKEEINQQNLSKKEEIEVPVKKNVSDLIDKFIKEDPRITSPKKIAEKPVPERTEMYNPMKKGKESLNDTQLPVSETLAKIFIVQGNFPKAIFAYQQLMLIFPEKKAFFAKQIKELEKKLNTK